MKVFISWSGERSRQVAELFKIWLKCVIQACDPWVSTEDIESGSVWFTEIGNQLSETTVGIICLTKENKDKPWILFEAGALTKGLTTSRVIPFLVDLETTDLRPPLSQLNGNTFDKVSLYKLVKAVNAQLKENALRSDVLETIFETYWPQFETKFSAILEAIPEPANTQPRNDDDILGEILTTVRSFDRRIRKLENKNLNSSKYKLDEFLDHEKLSYLPYNNELIEFRKDIRSNLTIYYSVHGKLPEDNDWVRILPSLPVNITDYELILILENEIRNFNHEKDRNKVKS